MSDSAPPGAGLPAQKQSRRSNVVVAIVLVGFIGILVLVAINSSRTSAATAAVGDCVAQSGENSIKVVGCDDPKAEYKMVGRLEDKTQIQAGLFACSPFRDQGAQKSYWQGQEGEKGMVLCLAPAR